jgi:hypothetical protein
MRRVPEAALVECEKAHNLASFRLRLLMLYRWSPPVCPAFDGSNPFAAKFSSCVSSTVHGLHIDIAATGGGSATTFFSLFLPFSLLPPKARQRWRRKAAVLAE